MPKQRVFVLEGSVAAEQRMAVNLFRGHGVKVEKVQSTELDAHPEDVAGMFRAAHAWANARKVFTAFPTFITEGSDFAARHLIVSLSADVAERFDATPEQLWKAPYNPLQFGHHFRVAHDRACALGYPSGFPTFFQTEKDGKTTHALVALKWGHALSTNVNLPQLGLMAEDDVAARMREVNRWAQEHGYVAGLPNFHLRDWRGRSWGSRTGLGNSEADLNQLLEEGWHIARVDAMKASEERAALVYLLEQ